MVILKYIHSGNIIQTEKVLFRNIYTGTYMHVITTNDNKRPLIDSKKGVIYGSV